MKKAKKILVMVAALALTAAIAVGGTLAYLTSTTETVENTFTVGKVKITLDEAVADEYGVVEDYDDRTDGNEYKLIPGHNYKKDPTVHVVAGSEECYLFVEVVNGISGIEADTTVADQMAAKGWTQVEGNIYVYNETVDAREAEEPIDVVVFEEFTLADDADVASYADDEGNVTANITIKAYAVQADGFEDSTAAEIWDAAFSA